VETLYLSSLTNADGLVIPQGVETLCLTSEIRDKISIK